MQSESDEEKHEKDDQAEFPGDVVSEVVADDGDDVQTCSLFI